MSAPKKNGFSQLPHGFHKRLIELKGARLPVWIAHRAMEGKDGESYPSLKRLEEYTGLNRQTVILARKWLRESGWLTTSGQKRTSQGEFSIPIEHTTIPPAVDGKSTHGARGTSVDGNPTHGAVGKSTHGAGGKTVHGKSTPEVDPKEFEVEPNEVHPPNHQHQRAGGGRAGDKSSETGIAGKENLLTEQIMLDGLQKAHQACRNRLADYADDFKIPVTPKLSGSRELFNELHRRGIIHFDQLKIACDAYESWFNDKYVESFLAVERAESQVEEFRQLGSDQKIFIPSPIACPLVVFRKELTLYLEAALEQNDESVEDPA